MTARARWNPSVPDALLKSDTVVPDALLSSDTVVPLQKQFFNTMHSRVHHLNSNRNNCALRSRIGAPASTLEAGG